MIQKQMYKYFSVIKLLMDIDNLINDIDKLLQLLKNIQKQYKSIVANLMFS